MNFTTQDFERMRYNIHPVLKTQNVLEVFPELKMFFSGEAIDERVIRYIIYMYDQNTPLRIIESIAKRRAKALALSSINPEEERYKTLLQGNGYYNQMIFKYCRLQRNVDFAELVFYEGRFYDELVLAEREGNAGKRATIYKNITYAKDKVKELANSFYNGGSSGEQIEYILAEAMYENLELRPEHIARKLRDNEPI